MLKEINQTVLRKMEIGDLEYLYEDANDFDISQLNCFSIQNVENADEIYSIIFKRNNTPIGFIELKTGEESTLGLNDNEAELCIWICKSYRKSIWGKEFIFNSIALIQKHGFDDLKLLKIWSSFHESDEILNNSFKESGFDLVKSNFNIGKYKNKFIFCFTDSKWNQWMIKSGSSRFNPIVCVQNGFVITKINGVWYQTDGLFNGIIR